MMLFLRRICDMIRISRAGAALRGTAPAGDLPQNRKKGNKTVNRNELYLIYGQDIKEMTKKMLREGQVAEEIPQGARIGLKPNLVVAALAETGATTHPEICEAIIEYLQEAGHRDITILEGSWVGDRTKRAFELCGFNAIGKRYGVKVHDTKDDGFYTVKVNGMELKICNSYQQIDYLINLPVLKGHCQTQVTCALKNMKGLIPDAEKRRFHAMGLHKPIAYLNKAIQPQLIVVDGICGDLDFEEGGNPVQMNLMMMGKDPVLVDAYVAESMGFSPKEIAYIPLAEQLGVGSSDLSQAKITEFDADKRQAVRRGTPGRKVRSLVQNVCEKEACSACYGNLVRALARMSDNGTLRRIKDRKIHIGQGYKGVEEDGIGVGVCCKGFSCHVAGCPPRAVDIVAALEELD